jgi:hypothetical protein
MQIDGHHTLTYVVARYAGINHDTAEKVAYSAQYVDEATNDSQIHFENGAMYDRIVSAHKMLDYRNTQELANNLVWIPFHFLPGNAGFPSSETPEGSFINRLICMPDSQVARDMLKMVAQHWERPYAAQMMGVAMHVYADTFAHQGFAGVIHDVNRVDELESTSTSLLQKVKDNLFSYAISESSPLGHGAALSFPDRPYTSWEYQNGLGKKVERDNTKIFLDAADAMCKAMQCWKSRDTSIDIDNQPGLTKDQLALIKHALLTINDDSGDARHKEWLKWLQEDKFELGAVDLSFDIEGQDSWKFKARGEGKKIDGVFKYPYSETFLTSDWKYFHDALKTYRLEIIRDVLPSYGICVA